MPDGLNLLSDELLRFLPNEWGQDSDNKGVFFSLWQSFGVKREHLDPGPRTFLLGDVQVITAEWAPEYMPCPEIAPINVDQGNVAISVQWDAPPTRLPKNCYSLFVTPITVQHRFHEEGRDQARERIEVTVALAAAFLGSNFVDRHLYEDVAIFKPFEVLRQGRPFSLPTPGQFPDIGGTSISALGELVQAMHGLNPKIVNRVRLSLRWYLESFHSAPVDAYIKVWIALETIGASGEQFKVTSIAKALSGIYGISESSARAKFGLGTLYGLRSSIAHGGSMPPQLEALCHYLRAVYVDLLLGVLGKPSLKAAEAALALPGFSIKSALKVARTKPTPKLDLNTAGAQHQLGIALRKKGDLDGALTAFNRWAEMEPTQPDAHDQIAKTLVSMGRMADAVKAHRKAIEVAPDRAYLHYNLSVTLSFMGAWTDVVTSCKEAFRLKADYGEAYEKLATALLNLGDPVAAVEASRKAVLYWPKCPNGWNNLAVGLLMQQELDEALVSVREAIRLKADYAAAHCNCGVILYRKGNLGGAIEATREAVRLQPNYLDALTNLGTFLADRRDYDGAMDALDAAIKVNPRSADAHFGKACVFARRGQVHEAADSLRYAIGLNGSFQSLARTKEAFAAIRDDPAIKAILG